VDGTCGEILALELTVENPMKYLSKQVEEVGCSPQPAGEEALRIVTILPLKTKEWRVIW